MAAPLASADEPEPGGGETYVALGDSFTSGAGIDPQRPDLCQRSTRNFPSLVAGAMDPDSFTDASCGGAKLTDLWAPQPGRETPPQLDAVGPDTTLVTFGTFGGNDVGLVDLAITCVLEDCLGEPGDENHQLVEAQRENLTLGIREVKEKAPDATIVAVGYGTYVPPGGCPGTLPLTAEESDYVQGVIDHLSDVIGEVAEAEGVLFADQREIPERMDHTACAPFKDQWIRGVDTGDGTDGERLHPSSAGMRAVANLVLATLGEDPLSEEPEEPGGPTPAELRAKARAALQTTMFRSFCTRAGQAGNLRQVQFRVRGGQGRVDRVAFRVGARRVVVDNQAPYAATRWSSKMRKIAGKPHAVIRVRVQSVTLSKVIRAPRPLCMRR